MNEQSFDELYEGVDVICAECGTNIGWWIKEKKRKAYLLENGDVVCTKKCFKEYVNSYFEYSILI